MKRSSKIIIIIILLAIAGLGSIIIQNNINSNELTTERADEIAADRASRDFENWDLNNNGAIDINELTKSLNSSYWANDLINKYDEDKDGTLSRDEMYNARYYLNSMGIIRSASDE